MRREYLRKRKINENVNTIPLTKRKLKRNKITIKNDYNTKAYWVEDSQSILAPTRDVSSVKAVV